MSVIEEEGLCVELEWKREVDIPFEMFETMRSLKEYLQSLKDDNGKCFRAKYEQENLNELLLRSIMDKLGATNNE